MEKKCSSFEAKIFVGLRAGYTNKIYGLIDVEEICQKFVDDVSLCVSITPTKFTYKEGREAGCIVGLINYPRFPSEDQKIKDLSLRLARLLMLTLEQFRVTVYFPDESIMLENEVMKSGILEPQKNVTL